MQPLFLKPVFQERIWGGSALKSFEYDLPSEQIGECWAVSAHPNGMSVIREGEYVGRTLEELWRSNRELFGNLVGEKFPLLTKLLDANEDLSIQVHPDDFYAYHNENGELGKTECWYIVDCKEQAEIIFGHRAQTKEEFTNMVIEGKWNELLMRVSVKKGDFFYVESGTVHALCSGVVILETQQNSDTTYRLYDYNRRDKNGKLRELHIEKSIDVTKIPQEMPIMKFKEEKFDGYTKTTFVKERYFSVYKYIMKEFAEIKMDVQPFHIVSILSGEGTITINGKSYSIKKGDHFILPHKLNHFIVEGNMEWVVSHP